MALQPPKMAPASSLPKSGHVTAVVVDDDSVCCNEVTGGTPGHRFRPERFWRNPRNSFGPLINRRLRDCRSCSDRSGFSIFSTCSAASWEAFDAASGLRWRVGRADPSPILTKRRIASARDGEPSCPHRHSSIAANSECCHRVPTRAPVPVAFGRPRDFLVLRIGLRIFNGTTSEPAPNLTVGPARGSRNGY
jgi:hypothetical protein